MLSFAWRRKDETDYRQTLRHHQGAFYDLIASARLYLDSLNGQWAAPLEKAVAIHVAAANQQVTECTPDTPPRFARRMSVGLNHPPDNQGASGANTIARAALPNEVISGPQLDTYGGRRIALHTDANAGWQQHV